MDMLTQAHEKKQSQRRYNTSVAGCNWNKTAFMKHESLPKVAQTACAVQKTTGVVCSNVEQKIVSIWSWAHKRGVVVEGREHGLGQWPNNRLEKDNKALALFQSLFAFNKPLHTCTVPVALQRCSLYEQAASCA